MVSVGFLKTSKASLKIKGEIKKKFSPTLHVPSKDFSSQPLLGKSILVRKSLKKKKRTSLPRLN